MIVAMQYKGVIGYPMKKANHYYFIVYNDTFLFNVNQSIIIIIIIMIDDGEDNDSNNNGGNHCLVSH